MRNPHFKEWSADAQPDAFADGISYKFGVTEVNAITAIEKMRRPERCADWMFDPLPAEQHR